MSTTLQNTGEPRSPYYRKFDVTEFGIEKEELLSHLRPVYDTLRWDMYDTVRGKLDMPTRKRALAEFTLTNTGTDWDVRKVAAQPYVQTTDHGEYNRTAPRTYPEIGSDVTGHPEVARLQKAVADIVKSVRSDAERLRMIFTFLRTVDASDRSGVCALEGAPHIDGMDYIVSALVINRSNLEPDTGESSVYTMDQKELMRAVLQPGEGIFQDDKNLMHHITNIRRNVKNTAGIRDMLGIDVEILSHS